MATTPSKTKVVTGPVRLSYVHLFEPFSSHEDQPERYSCVILVPKSDKKTIKAIRDAQQAALEAAAERVCKGRIPKNRKDTIRDGDEGDSVDLDKNPEYAGPMFMTGSSKTKAGIVDRKVQPILDSTEIYSGVWARVSINAVAFNTQGNKGVSFGLNHVQKVRDGDYLGGRSKAEDDFEPLDDEDLDDEDDVL